MTNNNKYEAALTDLLSHQISADIDECIIKDLSGTYLSCVSGLSIASYDYERYKSNRYLGVDVDKALEALYNAIIVIDGEPQDETALRIVKDFILSPEMQNLRKVMGDNISTTTISFTWYSPNIVSNISISGVITV